jgi:hypothetical protein
MRFFFINLFNEHSIKNTTMTQNEIKNWLQTELDAYTALVQKMDETAFFAQPHTEKWSAAQHTQHLIEAGAGVAGALRDKANLQERFGLASHAYRSLEVYQPIYLNTLAQLKAAGKFPYRHIETAGDRAALLGGLAAVTQKMADRMGALSEEDMDTHQMPHPVLGLMSVREMAEFIAYHIRHHYDIVEKY